MALNATLLGIIGASALMLVVGLALGYALRGRSAREFEAKLRDEVDTFRKRHETHKRRVTEHFSRSSDLFRDLTRHHAALYMHLAEGTREFCPEATPSLRAELRMLLADGESDHAAGRPGRTATASSYAVSPSQMAQQASPLDAVAPQHEGQPAVAVSAQDALENATPSAPAPRNGHKVAAAQRITEQAGLRHERAMSEQPQHRDPHGQKSRAAESDESFAEWFSRLKAGKQAAGGGPFTSGRRTGDSRVLDAEATRHGLRKALDSCSAVQSEQGRIAAAA